MKQYNAICDGVIDQHQNLIGNTIEIVSEIYYIVPWLLIILIHKSIVIMPGLFAIIQ